MNAFDYAIQLERDGYTFYTQSAENIKDASAKRMLLELAEDEKKHQVIIQELKEGQPTEVGEKISANVKNVFAELVESNQTLVDENGTLAEVLAKGSKLEGEAADLYQDFANKAETDLEKETWLKLMEIEKKHEKLLAMALEYIDQPSIVLEDAEFLFYDYDEAP